MKTPYLATLILVLCVLMTLPSCNLREEYAASATQTAPAAEAGGTDLLISSLEIVWPEPVPPDPCYVGSPAPEVSLCLANHGTDTKPVEMGYLVLPVGMVPGAEQALLGTLPGGTWSAPSGFSLTNFPGSDLGVEGIVIVNTNPAPDAAAAGIVIVNTMEGEDAIIIVDSIPQPGDGGWKGIIIIGGHPGEASANVGRVTITPGEGEIPGGELSSVEWLEPLEDLQEMEDGIVWGGLVLGADPEYIHSEPHAMSVYNKPPPDDGLGAIVWGGMPDGADGIIIVDSLPGSGESAHGIIIINSKDISQVTGIVMEDMPAGDSGEAGIIIVDSKPAEFLEAGINLTAAIWTGSEGIIIIGGMPVGAASLSSEMNFGFPEGLNLPDTMTAKMGQNPLEPQPMLFVTVDLLQQGIPMALEPGSEACTSFSLDGLPIGKPPPDDGYSMDAYFDLMVEMILASHGSSEGAGLIRRSAQLPRLPYPLCTATPFPVGVTPIYFTATPEPAWQLPTPTLRLGLPTYTPTVQQRYATPSR